MASAGAGTVADILRASDGTLLGMGTIANGQVLSNTNGALVGVTVSGAGDPTYAPGSFTLATGTYRIMTQRLILTGTQQITLQGTSRLRIT